MRSLLSILVVTACGGTPKPAVENPPPAESMLRCEAVADHVGGVVVASKLRSGATHDAVVSLVSTRCKADAWSDATKQCLVAIETIPEGRACAGGMTEEQRAKIKTEARALRTPPNEEDPGADWIKHVVEE